MRVGVAVLFFVACIVIIDATSELPKRFGILSPSGEFMDGNDFFIQIFMYFLITMRVKCDDCDVTLFLSSDHYKLFKTFGILRWRESCS